MTSSTGRPARKALGAAQAWQGRSTLGKAWWQVGAVFQAGARGSVGVELKRCVVVNCGYAACTVYEAQGTGTATQSGGKETSQALSCLLCLSCVPCPSRVKCNWRDAQPDPRGRAQTTPSPCFTPLSADCSKSLLSHSTPLWALFSTLIFQITPECSNCMQRSNLLNKTVVLNYLPSLCTLNASFLFLRVSIPWVKVVIFHWTLQQWSKLLSFRNSTWGYGESMWPHTTNSPFLHSLVGLLITFLGSFCLKLLSSL